MPSPASEARRKQREKALNHARELARLGRHADHTSIISHMQARDDYPLVRAWMERASYRAQLDALCTKARGKARE